MRTTISALSGATIERVEDRISFIDHTVKASVPIHNVWQDPIDRFRYYVPTQIFNFSKLKELSTDTFQITHDISPDYVGAGHNKFADWYRPFKFNNEKYIAFGFDKAPKIIVDQNYSAILATHSEDHKEELYNQLKYEFGTFQNVLSSKKYEFLGDIYESIEKDRESKIRGDLRDACKRYVPEAFPKITVNPELTKYDTEFERIYAEDNWETASKEVFFLFKKLFD